MKIFLIVIVEGNWEVVFYDILDGFVFDWVFLFLGLLLSLNDFFFGLILYICFSWCGLFENVENSNLYCLIIVFFGIWCGYV